MPDACRRPDVDVGGRECALDGNGSAPVPPVRSLRASTAPRAQWGKQLCPCKGSQKHPATTTTTAIMRAVYAGCFVRSGPGRRGGSPARYRRGPNLGGLETIRLAWKGFDAPRRLLRRWTERWARGMDQMASKGSAVSGGLMIHSLLYIEQGFESEDGFRCRVCE